MGTSYTIIRRYMRFSCSRLGKSQWRRHEEKSWWNKNLKRPPLDEKWKVRDFPTSDTANLLCILFIAKRKRKEFNLTKNESTRNSSSHASLALFMKWNCESSWCKNLLTQKATKQSSSDADASEMQSARRTVVAWDYLLLRPMALVRVIYGNNAKLIYI